MSGEFFFGLCNEGIGLGRSVLRSLSESRRGQRQHDPKRSARNQDSHAASLTAPNPRGQVGTEGRANSGFVRANNTGKAHSCPMKAAEDGRNSRYVLEK